MLLACKIGWAGIAFTLLTTGMLGQGVWPRPAGSDSNKKEEFTVFVIKNEIRKMQETLRGKGYYEGNADGVFGLQTRASIRAYQKAQNLPITGQVDIRTAAGLGVRPESRWDSSQSAERRVGFGSDIVIGEVNRDKPSAGIKRAQGRSSNTARKEPSRAIAMEDTRGGGADKQQAANEEHNQ